MLGALDGKLHVAHLLGDARQRRADAHLCLRGVVLRLDDLLAGPERLHLRDESLLSVDQLLLLRLELSDLLVETLEFNHRSLLSLERETREVLTTGGHRLPGLVLDVGDAGAHLLSLELETPLVGDHLHDAPLDVLEHLSLLVVGVIQSLPRVFGPVQQPVHLRFHHGRHP